jgi:hypothetical protein
MWAVTLGMRIMRIDGTDGPVSGDIGHIDFLLALRDGSNTVFRDVNEALQEHSKLSILFAVGSQYHWQLQWRAASDDIISVASIQTNYQVCCGDSHRNVMSHQDARAV